MNRKWWTLVSLLLVLYVLVLVIAGELICYSVQHAH